MPSLPTFLLATSALPAVPAHLQIGALQQPEVSRDFVTRLDDYNVSRHKLSCINRAALSTTDDVGSWRKHGLDSVSSLEVQQQHINVESPPKMPKQHDCLEMTVLGFWVTNSAMKQPSLSHCCITFSAFPSWKRPMATLIMTTPRMRPMSGQACNAALTTAAVRRIQMNSLQSAQVSANQSAFLSYHLQPLRPSMSMQILLVLKSSPGGQLCSSCAPCSD